MKVVILAGGRGTRLSEETQIKPKPLVEASNRPLLWHIMSNYFRFGFEDFVILAGYKGQQIREYFANYWLQNSDVEFDLANNGHKILDSRGCPWKVTVLDTGLDTGTGGRILSLKEFIKNDFLLTYGDGVSDVDINELLRAHNETNNLVTLTAVQPPARFGALNIKGSLVQSFHEKPAGDNSWVNGGFFVAKSEIFDFIHGNNSSLEVDVLPLLSRRGKLGAYKHYGYWQPVDTIRDLERLNEAIKLGKLPWI